MGTVLAAASALVLTCAGAAAALSAPFGAAGFGVQYLAGHVLLGLGLGHSIAILLRIAVKRLLAGRPAGKAAAPLATAQSSPVTLLPPPTPAATAPITPVTVLPPRPHTMAQLRGRHAA